MMEDLDQYPNVPGHKGDAETSAEAADAIAPTLGRLQEIVCKTVAESGRQGMTPEEAANLLGLSRVSVQPRFSELKRKELIVDSGMRRTNPSSRKRAVVWVLPRFVTEQAGGAA